MLSTVANVGLGLGGIPWCALAPLVPGVALLVVLRRLAIRDARGGERTIIAAMPDSGRRAAA